MNEEHETVHGTPFAVIPEWVLYASISDRALRLYMVLQRHVNAAEGVARPGRKRLAALLHCSTDTVDRAMQELVTAGALLVESDERPHDGGQTANRYHLRTEPPAAAVRPPLRSGAAAPAAPVRPQEREKFLNEEVPGVSSTHRRPGTDEPEQLGILGLAPPAQPAAKPRARDVLWDVYTEELGATVHENEAGKRRRACFLVRQALAAAGGMPMDGGAALLRERIQLAKQLWGKRGIHVSDIAVANQWSLLGRAQALGEGGGLTAEDIWQQAVDEGLQL